MSGIAGIVNLDGEPVDSGLLKTMATAAAYLGPDGIRYVRMGNAGFAHLALNTTPESIGERQPLKAAGSGLLLVADARVDNRDELIGKLSLRGHPRPAGITDADLILAAYEKWGEACPFHILGDFAIAIWDAAEQRLFCARDPFGVRPLFYYSGGRTVLIASTVQQILSTGKVPVQLNDRAIAHYLTGKPPGYLTENTFFEGVHRVRPAHSMSVACSGQTARKRYWGMQGAPALERSTSKAYAEEFLHLLKTAVRVRCRSRYPVAVFTSGGMDSSSIASLLGKFREQGDGIDFKMVSLAYGKGHPSDESPFVRAIADRYRCEACYLDGLSRLPFSADSDGEHVAHGPPNWWNDPTWHHAYQYVAGLGCRVAFNGQGADSLFPGRLPLFADRVRRGRLLTCFEEIWRHPNSLRKGLVVDLSREVWQAFTPGWLQNVYLHWRQADRLPSWINRQFALPLLEDATGQSMRLPTSGLSSIQQGHRLDFIGDLLYRVTDSIHRLASCHGVEPRDPYLDRRLVAFSLSLPVDQIYFRGVSKRVLRNAMKDILPDVVRLRFGKTLFDPVLSEGLAKWIEKEAAPSLRGWEVVRRGYVVSDELRRHMASFRNAPTDTVARTLFKPLLLEQWLQSINSCTLN